MRRLWQNRPVEGSVSSIGTAVRSKAFQLPLNFFALMQGPLDSLALPLPWALAAASLAAVKFGSLHAVCLSGSTLCVCVQGVQMQTDD